MKTKRKNVHATIRQGMRNNEAELLAHLRKYPVTTTSMLGMAWHNALDRLTKAGKVRFANGRYVARKGARPVTPATR